jgi:hypothetical protein
MKTRSLLTLVILFLLNSTTYSQVINETAVYTSAGTEQVDPWSLAYDENTGKYAYVKYDALMNLYSVIYDGKESGKYGFISNYDIKFDTKGNYYVLATEYTDPDTYTYDYVLLVNGDSITSYRYGEPYNAMVTKNDEFRFTARTGEGEESKTKIITYSISGGIKESEEYIMVKPIYKGDYILEYGEGDVPSNNLFLDKDGNPGYVVLDGITASLMFGDNIVRTQYTDIDANSFVYDKNGEMCFIAKNGAQMYTAPGNEFVVQGSRQHAAFDYVFGPILFTSNNIPIYTAGEALIDMVSNYFVVVGGEKQDVYVDAGKTLKAERLSGGIYDLQVDANDNITYYGTIYSEVSENKEGPNSKTAYIVNGLASKFYSGMGMWKANGTEVLVSYTPGNDYYTSVLMHIRGGKEEIIFDEEGYSVQDYGFTPDGRIYYVVMKEGNYDTKVKPVYSVYIDGIKVGDYEMILFEGIGNSTSMVQFYNNNYAYAASTFNYYEEGKDIVQNHAYVITNKGKQDPQILSGNAAEDFDYIENMIYSSNGRLFYIGGINNYTTNVYNSEVIVDGVNMGKAYTGLSNVTYDEATNTVSFFASREGTIYKVSVNL